MTENTQQQQQPQKQVDNTVNGKMNGAQAETIEEVKIWNIYKTIQSDEPDLLAWEANDEDLTQVRRQFIEPEGFTMAREALKTAPIVVLHGLGSGRFAATRLLDELGYSRIVHLNSARRLGSIDEQELDGRVGYIWQRVGPGRTPMDNMDFARAVSLCRTKQCALVILFDRPEEIPGYAVSTAVKLEAPAPVEVAESVIRDRKHDEAGDILPLFHAGLALKLSVADPPHKAVRAAELAIELASGKIEESDALRLLDEDADRAVAALIEDWWSTEEFTMFLAVAFLENKPFDRVAAQAVALDTLVRKAELPSDKTLRPRRIFTKPKDKLLRTIRAATARRTHPRHPGLQEQTVRFEQPDWADAVLRRFWQQYHLDHQTLLKWMCDSNEPEAAVKALCTVIVGVPAHDPLRPLETLAANNRLSHRYLAAQTLVKLADEHRHSGLVEETLDRWVESRSSNYKFTAALYYGSRFEQHTKRALAQLTRIARSEWRGPRNAVVAIMLALLAREKYRDLVLTTVNHWMNDPQSLRDRDGLRAVALEIALWILGIQTDKENILVVDTKILGDRYPDELRDLAWTIALHRKHGVTMLRRLEEWSLKARFEDKRSKLRNNGSELLRVVSLLQSDLRWWRRLPDELLLSHRHPGRRAMIRRIFRAARAVERSLR
ncbi:hypothetical protein ORV05_03050 [Amycolatopsis cynarae]|uniref:Uncharacterized protein n=1 Tax=Amycolatopsis cynarae TaxID=2995223 RepID=A0ABY7B3B8_9PSEU|nr:hypothetical protein [Amycolatopsis sp. HUAS 11-8]WAL66805.1 hypothetical protein ORV05_03050 [Amycolatopsis sp. HUAS 11-8]